MREEHQVPEILDLIEPDSFEQPPPRRLPPFFVPNLIGEYLLERPLAAYLSPLVILCLGATAALAALRAPAPLILLPLLVIALRLLRPVLRLLRDVREDYILIRDGVLVTAHVLGARACRDQAGNPAGVFLDCAVPLTMQRTSVGSVWIADTSEAMRLSAAGQLTVICLPRAPGSWRLYRPSVVAARLLV